MAQHSYREIERRLANHQEFQGNSARGVTSPGYISPGAMGCRLSTEEGERLSLDQKGSGLSYVVYSYNTPIAWATNDGDVYVTRQSFSTTTSRLQNMCRRVL